MNIIWVSDIHLNFLNENQREDFYKKLKDANGDAVVISGDIAESHNVIPFIKGMEAYIEIPVYFVLGNHDFYGSNLADVKRLAASTGTYLGAEQCVALNASTALLGVDGWGDTRNGDYKNSHLKMSDWIYIDDLRREYGKGMSTLKKKLMRLADNDANKLKRRVLKAIGKGYTKIIIVTHVPPIEEVCLNAGKKSTPSGLPFFSSKCLGDAIVPIVKQHKKIDFLWLSGHTHSRVTYVPLPNLTVKVAKAEYYHPQIEEIMCITDVFGPEGHTVEAINLNEETPNAQETLV